MRGCFSVTGGGAHGLKGSSTTPGALPGYNLRGILEELTSLRVVHPARACPQCFSPERAHPGEPPLVSPGVCTQCVCAQAVSMMWVRAEEAEYRFITLYLYLSCAVLP